MKFISTTIPGVTLLELERTEDERGHFARAFDEKIFNENGCPLHIAQTNISQNARAGTLRGMHFQSAPREETKLVRVVSGAVHDVVLDLRSDSPTFRKWEAFELSAENGRALYIPKGCAHGFQTLADNTTVFYEMGDYYQPESALGVRYDDPAFGIKWPETKERVISEKDRAYPDWKP